MSSKLSETAWKGRPELAETAADGLTTVTVLSAAAGASVPEREFAEAEALIAATEAAAASRKAASVMRCEPGASFAPR